MLFVYGTLMPGHLRWPLVEPFVVATDRATVNGRLYDTHRGYPAARFDEDGAISGHVLTFDTARAADAWRIVDEIEGNLYERVEVTTTAGLLVHSYAWSGSLAGFAALAGPWPGE